MVDLVSTAAISKRLSRNDTGETGAHMAGILIPKRENILNFFPVLPKDEKNPREEITFFDTNGKHWNFAFIYYNNKFFNGTRNEYRLTRMTKYLREHNLKEDDVITLSRDAEAKYHIDFEQSGDTAKNIDDRKLVLGKSWIVIKYKRK